MGLSSRNTAGNHGIRSDRENLVAVDDHEKEGEWWKSNRAALKFGLERTGAISCTPKAHVVEVES
jgi:hypothetical protein